MGLATYRFDKIEIPQTSSKSSPKSNQVPAAPVHFPGFIQPQLATLVDKPPDGANWFHEIKFDGYRMQCQVQDGKARIFTRNGNDWTAKLPEITRALGALPLTNGILDGELVSPRADGSTDFQSLQNAFRDKRTQSLVICFFDLMFLDGTSLVNESLAKRKAMLEKLLSDPPSNSALQYSRHIVGEGAAYARKAAELGLEGIVCKNSKSKYRSGRGNDWLKVKMIHKEEFVIGGYTAPEGSRVGLGALLVGYYDNEDRLHYAGKVGTGFEQKTLKMLESKLRVIRENRSPFDVTSSGTNAPPKSMWVKPELVAQIRYGSLTRDRILRHAVFEGLREVKPASEVVLDKPVEVEEVAAETKAKKPSKVNGGAKSKASQRSIPVKSIASSKDMFDGVRLTSQNKILDPQSQISKLDLATFYRDMSEWILPHIQGRPLVLVRCPQGIQDACFYQKHPVAGTPIEIRQIQIEEKTETDTYVIVDNAKGLVSLAQVGAMELHAWGSTEKNIDKPDRLVFDLDPDPTVEWRQVMEAAKKIKGLLEQLKLKSFVKTTGGKGLHIVVPIDRRNTWEEAKSFSKLIAQFIQSDKPDRYTLNMSKAERSGKIFIDYLRNERGATSVVAYSPRARPGTPVSTPIAWDELSARIRSDGFNIKSIERRLSKMSDDPWQDLFTTRQSIGTALKQLQSVVDENSLKAKRAK